jgi:hypothetical protein
VKYFIYLSFPGTLRGTPHRWRPRVTPVNGGVPGRTLAATGKTLDKQAEQQGNLRELSDPALIALWARARHCLALGQGSRATYDAARAEYERRLGEAS